QFGSPYPFPKGESLKWSRFARVGVKVDITKKLPKYIRVTLPSKKIIEAHLRYEELPKLCYYCGFFGHLMRQCPTLCKQVHLT
ncbi:hypothetical protein MKX01_002729, partial [Papaver californicum]